VFLANHLASTNNLARTSLYIRQNIATKTNNTQKEPYNKQQDNIKHAKIYDRPGLVAFYDIPPGN